MVLIPHRRLRPVLAALVACALAAQGALAAGPHASRRQTGIAAAGDAILGNPRGDVTVLEFFDYNCPGCRQASANLVALAASDPKLRVVLKEWPILSSESVEAARVSTAARMEDRGPRFLRFHESLLRSWGPANHATALNAAEQAGYDPARIQARLLSGEVSASLAAVERLARSMAIHGTPTFVVGGQVISGAVDMDALGRMVAEARGVRKDRIARQR